MTETPVSVRLDPETVARVDRIAEAMSKRAGGIVVKRGAVLRAALDRGLEPLEAELGLPKAKKPKRK